MTKICSFVEKKILLKGIRELENKSFVFQFVVDWIITNSRKLFIITNSRKLFIFTNIFFCWKPNDV